MCRLLAYLGPPVSLAELLLEPEHSLLRQSWAPRHQRHGTVNADGFGVGWYEPARRPEPARYRTSRPMWTDRSFASLAGVVASGAVLAAVRSATPPAPVEESGVPPFTDGVWLFAHNGAVDGFRGDAGLAIRRLVSERRLAGVEGASDSELLFALTLDHLDDGAPPDEALAAVVRAVEAIGAGRLNFMLTDGQTVAATAAGDTLYARPACGGTGEGSVLASEPFDEGPGWRELRDRALVVMSADEIRVGSLDPPGGTR